MFRTMNPRTRRFKPFGGYRFVSLWAMGSTQAVEGALQKILLGAHEATRSDRTLLGAKGFKAKKRDFRHATCTVT